MSNDSNDLNENNDDDDSEGEVPDTHREALNTGESGGFN